MQPNEIDKMHQFEETHWWFQGKKLLVESAIESTSVPEGRYLDIGCGTGMFLRGLGRSRFACGLDVSELALSYCQSGGSPNLIRASCDNLPFANSSFSMISLLDIVEHTDNDSGVLQEVYRICSPGGVVLITVPAFKFLWGNHDVANHHKKRYLYKELKSLGLSAGFLLERITYTNFFIFLPVLVRRLIFRNPSENKDSDLKKAPRSLNVLLHLIYKLEALYLKNANFPWGVSLLMVLRKPL